MEAEHVLNRLWIGEADKTDSGNYSCTIPGHELMQFPRAQVRVHVMDGKLKSDFAKCISIILSLFAGDFHAAVYGSAQTSFKWKAQTLISLTLGLILLISTV